MTGAVLAWVAVLAHGQDGGPLPPGPGVNLVYAKCQQCHPISYVVDSAGLPDFLWADTLSLMKQLGMKVSGEEEEILYRYLTTYLGTNPPPAARPPAAGAGGESVYDSSCAVCHGPRGEGSAGAFPPLAGHAAALAAADRSYLPLVVLYGLAGPIEVAGRGYDAVMPAWAHLTDDEIAAVLNRVTGWQGERARQGDVEPYAAAEIRAARGRGLKPAEVRERRPTVP